MDISCLADFTRVNAQQRPDATALVYTADGSTWTYGELEAESCRCANALQEAGIGEQDRVAYLHKNTPQYFSFLFGAAKLNAVPVAINWRLAPSDISHILADSGAKFLLVGDEFVHLLEEIECLPEQIVILGEVEDSPYQNYEDWIQNCSATDPAVSCKLDDTCLQFYTSGTTGLPKGVETTNSNLLAMIESGLSPFGFSPETVNLVFLPVFHISGSGWGIIGVLKGAKTVLMKDVDLGELLQTIPKYQITHVSFIPTVIQYILMVPNIEAIDLSSVKAIAYGASPISESVLAKAMQIFKADFFQIYGLTETSGGITVLWPEDHDPSGPKAHLLRSCGTTVDNHEVRIMDVDTGAEIGEGEVGEIHVRGPQVMRGYWNDQAANEAAFKDGWFRTGDAGYLKGGYLYIQDRIKDMIISGGENVYPTEIENLLMAHAGIRDAAVIGVPDSDWGEAVKALIVKGDESLTEEEVIAYCRENLAGFKCPKSVEWIEEVPRNPSGKILKSVLRSPYWEGAGRNVS